MPQIPVRGMDLMGKIAQAESIKSAKADREATESAARRLTGIRQASAGAMTGQKGAMDKLKSFGDPEAVKKVQEHINQADERTLEKMQRHQQIMARIASISDTPEKWQQNFDMASLTGDLPKEMSQMHRNAFGNRDYIMAMADEYGEMLRRAQEDKKQSRTIAGDIRKAEISSGKSKKHPYPTEEDITNASSLVDDYLPDLSGANRDMAVNQIATEINRSLEGGMEYGQASMQAVEKVKKDVQVEEGIFFDDATYTPQSAPSTMTGNMGNQYQVEGQLRPGARIVDPKTGRVGTYR